MKYITTPIYYVNSDPHVGTAYTTVVADALARYWRVVAKEQTFLLTGTDEHGAKLAEAAARTNQSPQALVDTISEHFRTAWRELNIANDGFIRTTDVEHIDYVSRLLQALWDAGKIKKGEYRGWYCVGCEEFKTGKQIGPDNTCSIHGTALIEFAEETYLFSLTEYAERLIEAIKSDTFNVWPESRKNEVLAFIVNEPLRDVAISRKNVAWGIPLPWDTSHTLYVWVDALLNYLSATERAWNGKKPQFPPTIQSVGKDILRFHAVIWPALLIAAHDIGWLGDDDYLPKNLLVHGYFTIDGQKMSKSLGNVITPRQLIDRYGVDGARYLLLTAVPFGADGDISFGLFDRLYSSDLANNLGNLVNRVQAMILKYSAGVVRDIEVDRQDIAQVNNHVQRCFAANDITAAIDVLRQFCDHLNGYIDELAPWRLAKESKVGEIERGLSYLAEAIFVLGALLYPFIPATSEKIVGIFGSSIADIDYATLDSTALAAGKSIKPVTPLFPRLA